MNEIPQSDSIAMEQVINRKIGMVNGWLADGTITLDIALAVVAADMLALSARPDCRGWSPRLTREAGRLAVLRHNLSGSRAVLGFAAPKGGRIPEVSLDPLNAGGRCCVTPEARS